MAITRRTHVRGNLLLALDTLRKHKFRSFLTVLGVLIGTTTVNVEIQNVASTASAASTAAAISPGGTRSPRSPSGGAPSSALRQARTQTCRPQSEISQSPSAA